MYCFEFVCLRFPIVMLATFLLRKFQLHNQNGKIKLVYYEGL